MARLIIKTSAATPKDDLIVVTEGIHPRLAKFIKVKKIIGDPLNATGTKPGPTGSSRCALFTSLRQVRHRRLRLPRDTLLLPDGEHTARSDADDLRPLGYSPLDAEKQREDDGY